MSSTRSSKSFKICATCAFWAGSRTPDGGNAVYDSSQRAKCSAPSGTFKNSDMQPQQNCGKWEVWPPLR